MKQGAAGPKKGSFLRRIFPRRGDGRKEAVRKIALLVLLCIFIGSGAVLLRITVLEPMEVRKENDSIRRVYRTAVSEAAPGAAASGGTSAAEPVPSFEELKNINPDIVGWIRVPNTVIGYPVLQSGRDDPEYYLKRNYLKKPSSHGSIFLNAECDLKTGRNLVLYGHSMNDGQMFAALLKYTPEFYRESPVIEFDTTEKKSRWKIIAVIKTNTRPEQGKVFPFMRTEFSGDEDYRNYVYQLRIRSTVDAPVDFRAGDRLLTLSTCSYEFRDFRTVIVAREVRSGEEAKVDTGKAGANPKTLYPDCWYEKYGGKKPEWPETLKEAEKLGLADWAID